MPPPADMRNQCCFSFFLWISDEKYVNQEKNTLDDEWKSFEEFELSRAECWTRKKNQQLRSDRITKKKIDQHHIHSRLVWGELKIIDVISSVDTQISQPIHFARALHAFYILPSTHDKNNANTLWDLNSIFVWISVLWRSSTWREMFETLNEPCARRRTPWQSVLLEAYWQWSHSIDAWNSLNWASWLYNPAKQKALSIGIALNSA